jgi:hypothetical protein
LPPAEGFGGTGINIIDLHNYPPAIADLPGNFTSKNEDSESPEWDTYTGMSKDIDNNKCAHLPGYNSFGPHDDWLIFGPMTGVSLANPALRFWETAFNWNDTSGSTHEFYIQYSADFDISTALAEGPILTHTPADHGIAPLIWLSVTVEFPDSIGVNDKVYFAWRYDGPEDRAKSKFDIWRVDYIEWFDSAVSDYEYLPGDVNMSAGTWPPAATGPDVTYLVNFFRGIPTSRSCLLGGFWCSADANGDCNVIGSDVTKLVNVFRGQGGILYCVDYAPAWPTQADLPEDAPEDWPNCETLTAE